MLLATSRICARPVTFYKIFDKYNGRERPGRLILSLSVGNSSHFSNVRLKVIGQWTTELSSVVYVEFRGDQRC